MKLQRKKTFCWCHKTQGILRTFLLHLKNICFRWLFVYLYKSAHTHTHTLMKRVMHLCVNTENSLLKLQLLAALLNMPSNLLTPQPHFHQQHNVWGERGEKHQSWKTHEGTEPNNQSGSSLGPHFSPCDLPLPRWIIANRLFTGSCGLPLHASRGCTPPEIKMRKRPQTYFVLRIQKKTQVL